MALFDKGFLFLFAAIVRLIIDVCNRSLACQAWSLQTPAGKHTDIRMVIEEHKDDSSKKHPLAFMLSSFDA